mmetsp:Transcript_20255/g.23277  ORF Transcript_20255/g.23277 Transcript_20255/m.23277 type:complete len:305 (-) Transcript_20255:90-1004(-)
MSPKDFFYVTAECARKVLVYTNRPPRSTSQQYRSIFSSSCYHGRNYHYKTRQPTSNINHDKNKNNSIGITISPPRGILFSSYATTAASSAATSAKSWSEEWSRIGLGAKQLSPKISDARITNLLFVQCGFGVDQHGDRKSQGATKAAVRAVRNAIEFNSIPGVIEAIPGGRSEMLIQVKLGVPLDNKVVGENEETGDKHTNAGTEIQQQSSTASVQRPMEVDLTHVAKVFPYGKLLEVEVVVGGLSFPTGRIVQELGDEDDMAICVAASVSVGYDNGIRKESGDERSRSSTTTTHTTYNTKDGY